jgi:DNA/RNA-binding domain of Phe-tRNA-synthetase-like protein
VRAESNKQNEQQKNEIKSKIRKQLVSIESLSEKKRINRYRQALQKVELMLQSQKLSQKEVLILRLTKEVIQEQLASKKGVK